MRKYFLEILILSFALVAGAQNFQPEYRILSNELTNAELEFLREEIADAQVVLLGETSHFEGAVFEVKSEIIKFLHEEMGFTTLAFESGSFGLNKAMNEIKKGKKGKEVFKKSLYGVWGQVEEFQPIANYFEKHHLDFKLFGFDISNTGDYSDEFFVEDFFYYLNRRGYKIKLSKVDLQLLIEGFDAGVFDEEIIAYNEFTFTINQLISEIEQNEIETEDYYWKLYLRNLSSYANFFDPSIPNIVKIKKTKKYVQELASLFNLDKNNQLEIGLRGFFVGETDNFRDRIMAQNLLEYMKRFPEEKIICWGANAHFINSMSSVDFPFINEFKPMGSYLKEELDEKVYSLGIVTAATKINQNNIKAEIPIQKYSFEDFLRNLGEQRVFISSRQEAMKTTKKVRFFSNKSFVEGKLNEFHDGYLYVDDTRLTTPIKNNFKENRFNELKLDHTNVRIIDSETKEPLPFVNIIVEGSHIGTISNEEGYLVNAIENKFKDHEILISYLGYQEKRLSYDELVGIIELYPTVTRLNEVVIKKKMSANAIMKTCVDRFKYNYPDHRMSFKRHFQIAVDVGDSLLFDIEFITRGHNKGYHRHWRTINELEQYKWNVEPIDKPKYIQEFLYISENSIMDGKYLDTRKWKKFDFILKESILMNQNWVYVIDFSTKKNFYTYTNRRSESDYSGTIYVNEDDFGIVKIKENWKFHTSNLSDGNNVDYQELKPIRHKGWAKSYHNSRITHETQITTYQKSHNGFYYQMNNDLIRIGLLWDNEEQHRFLEASRIEFYDYVVQDPEIHDDTDDKNWKFEYIKYDPFFWENFESEH
ncbi:MAG: erythromycin esterase family protein [Flavobacteriaceae bacterium]|nr:erythromycin esterase family protein [Flavobacteriaceae bacterium]